MLYLDTSALLKLYVREEGSDAVQAAVEAQSEPLPVWEIQEMELRNALQLKVFWGELTGSEAAQQLNLFEQRQDRGLYYTPEIGRAELMSDFRRLSLCTAKLGCRTLDVLHVACALQLKQLRFMSFDERQKQLAIKAGLDVEKTGSG